MSIHTRMSLAQVKHVTWADDYVTTWDDDISDDTNVAWSVPAKEAGGTTRAAGRRASAALCASRVSPFPFFLRGSQCRGTQLAAPTAVHALPETHGSVLACAGASAPSSLATDVICAARRMACSAPGALTTSPCPWSSCSSWHRGSASMQRMTTWTVSVPTAHLCVISALCRDSCLPHLLWLPVPSNRHFHVTSIYGFIWVASMSDASVAAASLVRSLFRMCRDSGNHSGEPARGHCSEQWRGRAGF
jgi:hypothetical protein